MANEYTTQILKDTHRETVIKLTADLSTDEDNHYRVVANSLAFALDANNLPLQGANVAKSYYGLSLHRLFYNVNISGGGHLDLFWTDRNGANTNTIFELNGNGEYNTNGGWISISNPNVTPNSTGDIGITTHGATNKDSYTLILDLKKDNRHYSAGQFQDPASFNYGSYSVTP